MKNLQQVLFEKMIYLLHLRLLLIPFDVRIHFEWTSEYFVLIIIKTDIFNTVLTDSIHSRQQK